MSLPKHSEYRDSGYVWLGMIPKHWRTKPLRYLTECLDGRRVPLNSEQRSDKQGLIPYWGANSVMDYVDEALFDEDLVLLGEDGAPFFDRTRPVAFFSRGPVWPNNHIHVLRPHEAAAGPYLTYALNATDYAQFIDGSTRDKLTQGTMGGIPIAWPPESERALIAKFLDRETAKIDALVEEQMKLVELLTEKRQAVIAHAVTKGLDSSAPMKNSGIQSFGHIPKHWAIKRIKHVKARIENAFVDGPFGSSLKSEHFIENGAVYVIESSFATQGNLEESELKTITDEHFQTVSRSQVREGDIVIAKIGAQFGKSRVLPWINKPAVVSGNSLKLTIDRSLCTVDWCELQLENLKVNGEIDLLANGSAQPALSLASMNNLPLLVPPMPEQVKIVAFIRSQIAASSALIAEAQAAIGLLQELRFSLISDAVTGKFDVRELAEIEPAGQLVLA